MLTGEQLKKMGDPILKWPEENIKKCFVCGGNILDNHPCFNFYEKQEAICMGCEGAEIEVWRVSLPGDDGGYYDRGFDSMAEGLKHMDLNDSFEVHREMINAGKYLSLPEFQGF